MLGWAGRAGKGGLGAGVLGGIAVVRSGVGVVLGYRARSGCHIWRSMISFLFFCVRGLLGVFLIHMARLSLN